jgi:serine protease inhibitor
MPMRSEYNISAPIYEMNGNNNRSSQRNVTSYNPNSNFADIDADTRLSDNLQNNTTCVNGINNYALFFFENMINIMNNAFVFSPYLIYTIFSSLYLASDGNTEVELKNYFNFPRSDVISEGLKDIQYNLKHGNCIIFSDNIDYDPTFCANINMFTKIRKVNSDNAEREAKEINMIINKMCGITKNCISANNIVNSNIVLLNYASISPVWTSHFSKVIKQNNIEFMMSYNQTFGYFDQPNLQVLEISSVDGFNFGIIYGDIELNEKNFKLITSSLKPTILEEVKIPKFKLQTKLRYTNILKETDLKTVFLDLNVPYLFKSECDISDCLQNIEFNVCENSIQNKKIHGFKTTKKFIVNKPFRFYLRSFVFISNF